jgi:thiol-disulfide isomerase/thioredoxin
MDYANLVALGLSYTAFLEKYGTEQHREKWQASFQRIELTESQLQLLKSFKRTMPVMVLAGAWCGDCVDQCPIFEHFSQIAPVIQIHYFDRDAASEFASQVKICGAARVPSVVFFSEDFQEVGRYGDKTLVKYRDIYKNTTGEACSTGLGGNKVLQSLIIQEWLEQFERAQLILRTSPRLRKLHND